MSRSPATTSTLTFVLSRLCLTPPAYEESRRRYPVRYLLHGMLQNYTVWGRSLGAVAQTRRLGELIIVVPDSSNSWFVNCAGADPRAAANWEDQSSGAVIPYVDAHFRTVSRRENRAIAGLSMGGFGALALGLRHPEKFTSLGSTRVALSQGRDAAAFLTA